MLGALGPGGTQHVAGEMFKAAARIDMTYVPYAGGAPAVNALLGGHVDAVIANHSEVGQQIEAGRIRPLAVIAPERIGAFADVPTMGELGLPSVNAVVWFGLNVPSGSPAVAVQRLHDEAVRALRSPEVAAKLATIGMQPVGSTSAAFDRHMRAESERFARIIASAGIKAE
jgi:tripartite-type tricarboxylate transporter receptor subunit TctC